MLLLLSVQGCEVTLVRLTCEGRPFASDDVLPVTDCSLVACLRLPGGKGGFGSMLRAIGELLCLWDNGRAGVEAL